VSAGTLLQAAVVEELLETDELEPLAVFDAPPVRAITPYAIVEDPVLEQADAAGVSGRVGTLAITFRDDGERPLNLRGAMAMADELVSLLSAELPDGWRIAGLRLQRSKLTRAKDGWIGRSEWAVRLFRLN
jgi:hypothetical protein